ncbi:unnamed protein product [marine sediment metagenome]|uniref:DUF5320 domain-containing protein n=1 Tax=marine sediment metagenome TaxID=412755 RepID=X1KVK5_9ZZZZ
MPGFDRTGPLGQGPLTGRGLGPCGTGIGFRRGFGRGFGRRVRFTPIMEKVTLNKDEEKKILEEELKELKLDRVEIEKRLKELK